MKLSILKNTVFITCFMFYPVFFMFAKERDSNYMLDSLKREFRYKEIEDKLLREADHIERQKSEIDDIQYRIDWMLGYVTLALTIGTFLSAFVLYRYNALYKEAKDDLEKNRVKFEGMIKQAENKNSQLDVIIKDVKDKEKTLLEIRPEKGKLSTKEERTLEASVDDINRLEILPVFLQHYQSKALQSMSNENWLDAIRSFSSYIDMATDEIPRHIYFQKGFCETKVGRYEEAIRSFKHALTEDKTDCESLFGLQYCYTKLKMNELVKEVDGKLKNLQCNTNNPFLTTP